MRGAHAARVATALVNGAGTCAAREHPAPSTEWTGMYVVRCVGASRASRRTGRPWRPATHGLHLGEVLVALHRRRAHVPDRAARSRRRRPRDGGHHRHARARHGRHPVAAPQPFGRTHVQPRLAQVAREPRERGREIMFVCVAGHHARRRRCSPAAPVASPKSNDADRWLPPGRSITGSRPSRRNYPVTFTLCGPLAAARATRASRRAYAVHRTPARPRKRGGAFVVVDRGLHLQHAGARRALMGRAT